MNDSYCIRRSEILKGVSIGFATMLLTLFIWENSIPSKEKKLHPHSRVPLDAASIRSALTRYFSDHSGNLSVTQDGVLLETLEGEGYMPRGSTDAVRPERWAFYQNALHATGQPSGKVCLESQLPSGDRLVVLDDGSVQERRLSVLSP